MLHVEQQAGHAPERENWRVFCAIDLAAGGRARLMEHIGRLQESVPNPQASWSRDQSIHLTLKFLGEIPGGSLDKLSRAATRAVEGLSPFRIRIEEPGAFPKHGMPRVLWIGVKDESGRLAELHARLENECAQEGFPREERSFHPHLTLARLRKPQGARALAAAHTVMPFEPIEVSVSELLVIRSELSSAGSKYTVLSRHSLVPPAPAS